MGGSKNVSRPMKRVTIPLVVGSQPDFLTLDLQMVLSIRFFYVPNEDMFNTGGTPSQLKFPPTGKYIALSYCWGVQLWGYKPAFAPGTDKLLSKTFPVLHCF